MGAIVQLHDAHRDTRPALDEIQDPLFQVTQAFRRFVELSGCSDHEIAQWMNQMTRSHRLRPVHIRRWKGGDNCPPADYFLVALWLAGPSGLEVLKEVMNTNVASGY